MGKSNSFQNPIASTPNLGKIVIISLAVLSFGLAVAWIGFILTQY